MKKDLATKVRFLAVIVNFKKFPVIRELLIWIESANNAIEGVLHAAKTQRHIKFHLIFAFFLLFFCFVIGIQKHEFIMITIMALLVIAAEMFNSALEVAVDLISPQKKELARIIKDIAAGAVLVLAVGASMVGYLILWPYMVRFVREGPWITKHYPENIALLAVIIVMVGVIILKAYSGTGHPLRGGFPSGHAAISFSLAVSIVFIAKSTLLSGLAILGAAIVSFSRLRTRVHSWPDIVIGALAGSLVTFFLFFLFY